MSAISKVYGLLAEFSSAAELYDAAKKVRDHGFRRWDVYSPFPIHGMDAAMGLKRSIIPFFVFFGGLGGALGALALQGIPSLILYPVIVNGKPTNLFTIPAFFPIIFEMTILFSALTAIACLFIFNRLPRLNHPLFNSEDFARVTNDGFFMAIEATDPQFSEGRTRELLEGIGAKNITLVHDED